MGRLIYVSAGSNLGNRFENLKNAVQHIRELVGEVTKVSPVYETPPWGFDAENNFLNICLELKSALPAVAILDEFKRIESQLGRLRSYDGGYISRTIDLDIIAFGSEIIESEKLRIPHPHMSDRKFVLIPLRDIAPDFVHPVTAKSIQELINNCSDNSPLDLYRGKISWL